MNLNQLIQFQKETEVEDYSRYNSWKYCYKVFGDRTRHNDTDYLALHLGFYLASWGMYRGSAGLLQKDYKIHIEAVDIILSYTNLRCDDKNEVSEKDISEIITLRNELRAYYGKHKYLNGREEVKNISPTDTLISKIMLGTLGCVPAFDRLFIDGAKLEEESFVSFSDTNIDKLFICVEANKPELIAIQTKITAETDAGHLPIFKIIDMYLWKLGYDREVELAKENKLKK